MAVHGTVYNQVCVTVQATLQQFTGASAISSSDYFGDGPTSQGRADEGPADEFMNRLSHDVTQVKNLATEAGRKIGDLVSNWKIS